MTIAALPTSVDYVATLGQTTFPVPFSFIHDGDIRVYRSGVLQDEADFELVGSDIVLGTAATAAEAITLVLAVVAERLTDLPEAGPLRVDQLNDEVDRLYALGQGHDGQLGRTLRQPVGDADDLEELPAAASRASLFLAFDSDGQPIAASAVTGTPLSAWAATLVDDTTASAALTTLGVSSFAKTLLDDTTAAAARTTLGLLPVSVKDRGAVGDGVTDDTAAIQAILDDASNKSVYLPAGSYKVTNLNIRSGTELWGTGPASVLLTTSDSVCLASRNWYSSKGVGASGYTRIHDLAIRGDNNQTKSSQHGIILRDYYSDLYNLHLVDLGGSAIRLVAKDDAGTEIVGNLVENSIRDIRIERCRGVNPLYLGESDVSALTDGLLQNVFLYAYRTGSNTSYTLIRAGRAAGWVYANIHAYCYGTSAVYPVTGMHLTDGWATHLSNIYIEEFEDTAIYILASGQVSLSNVLVRADQINAAGTASALYVDASGSEAFVSVHGLSVYKGTSTYNVYALNGETGVSFYSGVPNRGGTQRATIAPTGTGGASYSIGGNGFYQSGSGTPVGSVTPRSIGDQYLDTAAAPRKWYKAVNTTSSDWVALN